MVEQGELAKEQAHFDTAWDAREKSRQLLQGAWEAAGGPNKVRALVKRNGELKAKQLGGPEEAVAFGRFDRDGETLYIGNHCIANEDRDLLVINWQADAANAYYAATVQEPLGVERKRTYATTRNQIDTYTDTLFEHLARSLEELTGPEQWGVDDAILDDLEAGRTGLMRDIVQTIHASQNELIRSPIDQLLIVQGGPGTGKTAIALHRISWLLFNYRDRLQPADCLVIGPNPTFTRYIREVLPGLGDQDVRHADLRSLGPQRGVGAAEDRRVSRLKGDARMADLLRHALWQRVGLAEKAERLTLGAEGLGPSAEREEIEREIDRLRQGTYNDGRTSFRRFLQDQVARRSRSVVTAATIDNALERVWPQATPQSFLRDLFASRERMLAAAGAVEKDFTVSEIRRLLRAPQEKLSLEAWSDADVALLDELDYLLNGRPTTFGHVVVDEAQDLSPMQLRSIRRRSRSGSMTVVGDIAQSTGSWARDSWDDVRQGLGSDLPTVVEELSLGYRVPRQVYEFAAQLLPVAAPLVTPPRVVRDGPQDPELIETASEDLALVAVRAARHHAGNGQFVGLICCDELRDSVVEQFRAHGISYSDASTGEIGKSINLASPVEAKGLEFDAVVIVDPAAIVRSSDRGHRLLYVALTRTTRFLTVVHDGVALPIEPMSPDSGLDEAPQVLTIASPPETATEERLTDVVAKEGRADRRAIPPSSRAVDRLTRSAAREIAAEVRDALQPSTYRNFLVALCEELGVDLDGTS
ncbi:HelD family protein [Ornithinimicrobium tianjinense]|uniref:DNA helicase n=1 Tax=Ornithinimicrobium tianjinense TaxID=1195761 RepID=A0A917BET8_9MICO|nr:UvrD-helicase domain-containing protein [Ornithinimicrobium tianjinense]GGF40082.1 DNA helicase [Ornithinimicrobium tianjinense]